ncbi:MAG TPA: sialate O-acetylesterase [Prosthecobacter sp.]|nr:sialate O-acetylesterase [Prosthecobacter sp.]
MKPLMLCLLVVAGIARGALELPAIFSDHAVLQRDRAVPVWGWAEPGGSVTVAIAGQEAKATAGADGKWRVDLPKLDAKGPQTLTVTAGSETKTIQDVLVGEVWLASGQSNMAMTVSRAKDFNKERAAAKLPEIRVFTERSAASAQMNDRPTGTWVVCTPETVGSFSATAFFFGREIHQALQAPVGIINSSVGGTPIESWIRLDVQHAHPALKEYFAGREKGKAAFDPVQMKAVYEKQLANWKKAAQAAKAAGKTVPRQPQDPIAVRARKGEVGGLFNGKIAPLIPYAIRGALWYQGEANSSADKAQFYQHQLPLLVQDWRGRWGYEFPFAWVQLPNYASGRGEGWMRVREAALKSVQSVPNSGMAVTLDIGEEKNIHPNNKQEVGRRLALWALGTVYGKERHSQPWPVKHEVKDGAIQLTMTEPVRLEGEGGFVIAGADKVWHPAKAEVRDKTLIISSAAVTEPVAVRYAWEEMPKVTLWTEQGIPVTQFRTDSW